MQLYKNAHTTAIYLDTTAQSSNPYNTEPVSQSVGANFKRQQKSLLLNTYNSGNPNSIVVNLNMLCGCKEKWNELEF
jgi:hypothetical protein